MSIKICVVKIQKNWDFCSMPLFFTSEEKAHSYLKTLEKENKITHQEIYSREFDNLEDFLNRLNDKTLSEFLNSDGYFEI